MKIMYRGIGVFFIQKVCGESAGNKKIMPPSVGRSLRYCRPSSRLAGVSAISTRKTISSPFWVDITTFGSAWQAAMPCSQAKRSHANQARRDCILFSQAPRNDFGDVENFHGGLRLFFCRLFGNHAHTKRTAGGHRFGARLFQLPVAIGADPLGSPFLVLPKLSTAGAAAKTIAAIAVWLGQLSAGGLNQGPRLIKNAIVTAEITGIVIGDRAIAVGGEL